jgi:hypothetical protein
MPNDLKDLIQFLQSNNFKAEYKNCNSQMDLSETAFFDAENFTPEAKELLKERNQFNKEQNEELKEMSGKKSLGIETTKQTINIEFKLKRKVTLLNVFQLNDIKCRSLHFPKVLFYIEL